MGNKVLKPCKDCTPGTKRPAPHPGPRCATHHRQFKKAQAERAHDKAVTRTYGLEPGQYAAMYKAQGGKCAICQRATGKTKRLAVDHRHSDGVVRGLLCGPCNQMLGDMRDDPDTFQRAAYYLRTAPPIRVTNV